MVKADSRRSAQGLNLIARLSGFGRGEVCAGSSASETALTGSARTARPRPRGLGAVLGLGSAGRRARLADEAGNITIGFLACVLLVSVMLVGVIDLGGAFATRSNMENDLAVAVDSTKASGSGLVTKNADDPGKAIAEQVVSSLRQNGTKGRVCVWVEEAPASAVPQTMRAIGVYVTLEGKYVPMTLGKLLNEISLGCENGCSVVPYSIEKAWRPATDVCGVYVAEEGASDVVFTSHTTDEVPAALTERVQDAISDANQEDDE